MQSSSSQDPRGKKRVEDPSPSLSPQLSSSSHVPPPPAASLPPPTNASFVVSVTGQIESCNLPGINTLYCKYDFVHGVDWTVIEFDRGWNRGLAKLEQHSLNQSVNIFGWPQLTVSVYGPDFLGRDVVRGYGSVHVPTIPGRYQAVVPLFVPVPLSLMDRVTTVLAGARSEFFRADFPSAHQGREVTRVRSYGHLKVQWNVMTKNTAPFGYVFDQASSQN